MSPIRVLLADDHALVRAGIRALLQRSDDIVVVAEAEDGREALRLAAEVQPDVVLMDITMPGLNGLDATARVTKESPDTRVIILSMHANEEYVLRALQAGAAGYLLKDAATGELEEAIKAIARGETYFSPLISKSAVVDYARRVGAGFSLLDLLTPRQREVLQLIAESHTTQGIALALNVSVKTVETHRAQLMERLDIHEVAGLVRYAIRMGLATADAQPPAPHS